MPEMLSPRIPRSEYSRDKVVGPAPRLLPAPTGYGIALSWSLYTCISSSPEKHEAALRGRVRQGENGYDYSKTHEQYFLPCRL